MPKILVEAEEICTTQRAAEILGVSVSSIQHLVEAGAIDAWKTPGGHRRIPLAAVMAYKQHHAPAGMQEPTPTPAAALASTPTQPTILVVEDNPMQRQLYQKAIASWALNCQLVFCENGYQALLEIARRQPDIMLVDIMMEGIDGYELINTIIADPQLRPMHIAILSALEEAALAERGGLPAGTVFFSKPINHDELRGYLRACCAHVSRHRR